MQLIPLSVDWLALTLRLNSRIGSAPAGHTWAFYSSTNVWNSRWCLFNDHGEKVFTILFQPKSHVIASDCALFEVANEWLYHGLGITGVVGLLRQCCDFDILGISRFDLAADFNPSPRQAGVIKRLARGDCYVQKKQNRVPWWQSMTDPWVPEMWRGEIPYDQSWGHKTTDIKWKLYYKTKELRDNAGGSTYDKPYIVDMWRDVGLEENNVWRLEVAVHNANRFDFMGERLTFDKLMHSGSNLFQSLYTSRFAVRARQGHVDRSNDRIIPFLPVGAIKDQFKCRRSETATGDDDSFSIPIAKHNGSLTLLRHLTSDIMTEQVLLNEPVRESVLSTIEVIIERDGLHRYFRSLVESDFDDWKEWIRVKAYYFGEENLIQKHAEEPIMEMAMVKSGLIRDTTENELADYKASRRVIFSDDIYAKRYNRLRYLDNISKQVDNLR